MKVNLVWMKRKCTASHKGDRNYNVCLNSRLIYLPRMTKAEKVTRDESNGGEYKKGFPYCSSLATNVFDITYFVDLYLL